MWAGIRGWIISLTVIVMIYSIIELLMPEGNLSKYARVVLGLMISMAILSPIAALIQNGLQ
ncbi:MAG: stage III sporulation protein AF [Christensenellales bacterium]